MILSIAILTLLKSVRDANSVDEHSFVFQVPMSTCELVGILRVQKEMMIRRLPARKSQSLASFSFRMNAVCCVVLSFSILRLNRNSIAINCDVLVFFLRFLQRRRQRQRQCRAHNRRSLSHTRARKEQRKSWFVYFIPCANFLSSSSYKVKKTIWRKCGGCQFLLPSTCISTADCVRHSRCNMDRLNRFRTSLSLVS